MAKKTVPNLPRRADARERVTRQRRQQNMLLIGAGTFLVLLIAGVIGLQIWNSQPVAGEASFSSQGNNHIPVGQNSPLTYNSTPPTSGPHYDPLANWGVHNEPVRYEQLIHNLEDGGVIVYYQCPEGCPETVDQLKNILQPFLNQAESRIILAPNDPTFTDSGNAPVHKDMGAKIALTAWGRLLLLDEVDAERIGLFIQKYRGIDHHVAGVG